MDRKAMTVRLDDEMAAALEAVARTDEMPVSEAVRQAIYAHIETRRGDAEFRQKIANIIERDRKVLERLREDSVVAYASTSGEQAQASLGEQAPA